MLVLVETLWLWRWKDNFFGSLKEDVAKEGGLGGEEEVNACRADTEEEQDDDSP